MAEEPLKRVVWMGSSLDDLRKLSGDVQDGIGFALYHAQRGERHPDTKMMKGFGPGVLEIIEDDSGGTYRAVYTIRFAKAVYVLHVFQKKSKKGIKTPKRDVDLIDKRLQAARLHYQENQHAL
jgi:phage-related protein